MVEVVEYDDGFWTNEEEPKVDSDCDDPCDARGMPPRVGELG